MVKLELTKEEAQEVVNGLLLRANQIGAIAQKIVAQANEQLGEKKDGPAQND